MKQLAFVIAIAIALNAQPAEAQQTRETPQHAPGWGALKNSQDINNQNSLRQRNAEFCWCRFGVLPGFPFHFLDQDFNRLPHAIQKSAKFRDPAKLPSASEAWVENQIGPKQPITSQPQRLHQPGTIEQTQATTIGQLPTENEAWAQTRIEPTYKIQPQDQRLNRTTATTQLHQTQQETRFQQGVGQLEVPSGIIVDGTHTQTTDIVQHQRRDEIQSRPATDEVVIESSSPILQRPISQDAIVIERESSEFPQTEILLSETVGRRQDQRLNRATATTQLHQTQQETRFQQGVGQLEVPSGIIVDGTHTQTTEIVQHQSRPATDEVVIESSSAIRQRPISQDAMVAPQQSSEFPQTEILLSETDGRRILEGQHLVQQEEEGRVSNLVTDSALSSSAVTAVQQRTKRQSQGSKPTLATKRTQRNNRVVRRVRNQGKQRTGSAFLMWVPWWLLPIAAWYGYKWWSSRRQGSAAEARLENSSHRGQQRVTRSRNATAAKTNSKIGPVPPRRREQANESVVSNRNNLVEAADSTIQTDAKTTERQTINKERLTADQKATVHSRSEDPRTQDLSETRSQETISLARGTEGESNRNSNEIHSTTRRIETEPAKADSGRSEFAQIHREPTEESNKIRTTTRRIETEPAKADSDRSEFTQIRRETTDESIRSEADSRVVANQSPEAEPRRNSRDERFDWTSIEGVDAKIQEALYQRGYNRFEDLEQLEPGKLRSEIAACGLKMDQSDCQRWIERASQTFSIGNGDSRDRSEGQRTGSSNVNELTRREQSTRSIQSESDSNSSNGVNRQADDLTRIKGIGPATVELLNQSGIHSFADLRDRNLGQLQQILRAGGDNFQLIDPVSWHAQATHAAQCEWQALELWEKEDDESAQVESRRQEETTLSFNTSSEDLTQIRGIGPATQQRLNDAGVFSLSQIANMDTQQFADVLGDQDGQFNLVDPETWQSQAKELIGSVTDIDCESGIVSEIRDLEELADEVADFAKDLSREETLESAVDR